MSKGAVELAREWFTDGKVSRVLVVDSFGDHAAIVVTQSSYDGVHKWFCGYVVFDYNPCPGVDWDKAPGHGEITYSTEPDENGAFAVGFDCNHIGDADDPTIDVPYVVRKCNELAEWALHTMAS